MVMENVLLNINPSERKILRILVQNRDRLLTSASIRRECKENYGHSLSKNRIRIYMSSLAEKSIIRFLEIDPNLTKYKINSDFYSEIADYLDIIEKIDRALKKNSNYGRKYTRKIIIRILKSIHNGENCTVRKLQLEFPHYSENTIYKILNDLRNCGILEGEKTGKTTRLIQPIQFTSEWQDKLLMLFRLVKEFDSKHYLMNLDKFLTIENENEKEYINKIIYNFNELIRFGNYKRIEEILRKLDISKLSPQELVIHYMNLNYLYFRMDDFKKAKFYIKKSLDLSIKNGFRKEEIETRLYMLEIEMRENPKIDFISAIREIRELISKELDKSDISKEKEMEYQYLLSTCYNELGLYYLNLQDYGESIENCERAKQIIEKISDENLERKLNHLIFFYQNIAVAKRKYGLVEESISSYEKLLFFLKDKHVVNYELERLIYSNLANAYLNKKDYLTSDEIRRKTKEMIDYCSHIIFEKLEFGEKGLWYVYYLYSFYFERKWEIDRKIEDFQRSYDYAKFALKLCPVDGKKQIIDFIEKYQIRNLEIFIRMQENVDREYLFLKKRLDDLILE